MSNWISVEDRLPEASTGERGDFSVDVLVCDVDVGIEVSKFYGVKSAKENWSAFSSEEPDYDFQVTHWQELPEPPTKQQG